MQPPIDPLSDVAEAPLCWRRAGSRSPTPLRVDRGSVRDLRIDSGDAVAGSPGAPAPRARA